ncbi:hypothetical protein E8E12_003794 [Didymella heteroderae]|uniref:Metallo-beta-lactamase domain-containing protein n=1 Tax=Didymella heteroderae TaxID=1769908 RepID=A0A9P4WI73_9PLEO|nr:hypothetical protein E8E12_003794 [Didymella heteroderae]
MAQDLGQSSVATVSVHALSCGHFTLPEHQFVKPSNLEARKTVPSLAFLIQHKNHTGRVTRILFDLGLRRDLKRYPPPIQKHTENRRPIETDPDVIHNLARGGLKPDDIDYIIYSHVHWDHVGEPRDFPISTFVVGYGSLELLTSTSARYRGGHSFFEPDLLPAGRIVELSDPLGDQRCMRDHKSAPRRSDFSAPWRLYLPFALPFALPRTLDIFGDGSAFIVDAPGHLPGHINLLARISEQHFVYLGGDACHDRRLLTGEKQIGEWTDAEGHVCCIHVDREAAEETICRIRQLEEKGVEVVFAHDVEWENDPENKGRFFGAG